MSVMENADEFLSAMRQLDPTIHDAFEAFGFALNEVPKVDDMTWLGEIRNPSGNLLGVFHSVSRESRWFPGLTAKEALEILTQEIL